MKSDKTMNYAKMYTSLYQIKLKINMVFNDQILNFFVQS